MTQTRTELENQLASLHRDQGAARTDGLKFDHAVIAEAEAELEALTDAEGEAARRQREQAAQEWERARRRKLEHLIGSHERRLAAWQDASVACRTLMDALRVIRQESTVERIMWSELAPGTVPNGLAPSEVDRHISGRLGAELSTMAGHSSRLGGIEWTGTSLFKAGDDWRSAEEKTMAAPMAGWIEEMK